MGLYYASQYPQQVKRLILIDPAPINTPLLIKAYERLMARFSPEEWDHLQALYDSDAYLAGDPATHNEAMRLSEGATFYNVAARDVYLATAVFDSQKAQNAVAINGPAREMKLNITVQEQLAQITCPILILQGREDFIPHEAAELAQQLIKDSQLFFVPQSGHYPFIEAKEAFFDRLYAFIEQASGEHP